MHYTSIYQSPVGEILLAADNIGIVGIWFRGQKYHAHCLDKEHQPGEIPVIQELRRWLDVYFTGQKPDFEPPVHMIGTAFQVEVWRILQKIPYGAVTTYKAIAQEIARNRGVAHMSAQAVGTAVGRNPVSVLIPCHRVMGANHSLAGYAGGIDKKIKLLKLEGAFRDEYFIPKHASAP